MDAMAPPRGTAKSTFRPVSTSDTIGVKREREEETRRVSQHIRPSPKNPKKTMLNSVKMESSNTKTKSTVEASMNNDGGPAAKNEKPLAVNGQKADDETVEAPVEEDVILTIRKYIMTLACSKDETTLQTVMRKLLENLYDQDRIVEKQQVFLRVGGPIVVVAAMKKHPGCEELQLDAFGVLINATFDNTELETVVAEVGAMQAIAAAMKRFPASEDIQTDSLKALYNLTNTHAPNVKIIIMEKDIITCIMNALKKFPDSSDLVLEGCSVLSNLSKVESLKTHLNEADVVIVLAAAIAKHKEKPVIQEYARRAMKALL